MNRGPEANPPGPREDQAAPVVEGGGMEMTIRTPPDAPTETELLAQARRGSPEAFRLIVEQYADRLQVVVSRILGNPADAEEVVQETFLKAYRSLGRFQEGSALYTWLYRIAVNASVDASKRERRRRHLSLDTEEFHLDGASVDRSAGPTGESERKELSDLVKEGIDELPERYRVILVLREYEDLSYEKLGEILDLPKGTVESRLFRARAKLKDWLLRRFEADGLDPEAFGW